ncbi:type IVB secretion system protein IcmH/DotU [Pseudomonas sp. 7P_10.2_Bac1]|uniref:type IVB secretion system protein IcmH/DotU n=1 Tax=Pseudomonas sp. 7P_10.2_Bac1 TaxID=2971614 RepID=UPI0021CA84C0|nr:type IVB secretion system protein IcmH/DotU [Pseudomonas sp. 7P_10.2_Bac1]MCU1726893.1 type IVB secretion system protein IcmH/DotU [Pseudomonas sp. 7P_10.2_Bac1]
MTDSITAPHTDEPDPSLNKMLHEVTDGDSTASAAAPQTPQEREQADPQFQLRGLAYNPLADAAMPLFGLVIRLRSLDQCKDVPALYRSVHNQITTILEEVRQSDYDDATRLAYSYSLCLLMDETVMATPWGKHSTWSGCSLLSDIHKETWGGEKFFTVLSRLQIHAAKYQHLLEFMYLCLCMGLKGKYALQPNGDAERQKIITKLHRTLRELRGPAPERLTDPLSNVAPRHYRVNQQWPWWTPWAAVTAVLMAAYTVYAVRLNTITQEVLHALNGILNL